MTRKCFGWTGEAVATIGQGTYGMGESGSKREEIDALRRGIDLGMTHIDTAEMYAQGRAEEIVAEAIRGQREKVFLASKVLPSNASFKGTIRSCNESLRRLKTDYLDLYLLHWPSDVHPLEETMEAFEKLIDEGKIRYAGVSNFSFPQLKKAQQLMPRYRIACNQVLYHLEARQLETSLLPYCHKHQIALVGYSPFAQGGFSFETAKAKVLKEIGRKYGKTARQVALNFLTREEILFTIPKAASIAHVEENAGGTGWTLEPEDLEAINRAFPPPEREEPLGVL